MGLLQALHHVCQPIRVFWKTQASQAAPDTHVWAIEWNCLSQSPLSPVSMNESSSGTPWMWSGEEVNWTPPLFSTPKIKAVQKSPDTATVTRKFWDRKKQLQYQQAVQMTEQKSHPSSQRLFSRPLCSPGREEPNTSQGLGNFSPAITADGCRQTNLMFALLSKTAVTRGISKIYDRWKRQLSSTTEPGVPNSPWIMYSGNSLLWVFFSAFVFEWNVLGHESQILALKLKGINVAVPVHTSLLRTEGLSHTPVPPCWVLTVPSCSGHLGGHSPHGDSSALLFYTSALRVDWDDDI